MVCCEAFFMSACLLHISNHGGLPAESYRFSIHIHLIIEVHWLYRLFKTLKGRVHPKNMKVKWKWKKVPQNWSIWCTLFSKSSEAKKNYQLKIILMVMYWCNHIPFVKLFFEVLFLMKYLLSFTKSVWMIHYRIRLIQPWAVWLI